MDVDFETAVAPHRAGLHAHCYRMLGSLQDAEDALQEALLRAWRGLPSFEGRSSLRSWLYRIATNVCLRAIERRPRRVLPADVRATASDPHRELEPPTVEQIWLDPYPDDALPADEQTSPEARYEQRESVELAFIAALQHLPERQRAVLLLRDVLGFAPAEIATTLDTTAAAVSSTLQRAHAAVEERLPPRTQQATLRAIGDAKLTEVVTRYVRAWEDSDVDGLLALLADDATFAMPPWGEWYRGRAAIGTFLERKPMASHRRWQLTPVRASGQVAFAFRGGDACPHSVTLLTLDPAARIIDMTSFLAVDTVTRFERWIRPAARI